MLCTSSSSTDTATVPLVAPAAEAVTVTDSLARSTSATPVIVTVWGVAKFTGVKVSVSGPALALAEFELSSVTVTFATGWNPRCTLKFPEPASPMARLATEASIICVSSSMTVAVTLRLVSPDDTSVRVTDSLVRPTSAVPVTVTVWSVFQFAVVKVSAAGPVVAAEKSPLETFTVVVPGGCAVRRTPKVAVPDSLRLTLAVEISMPRTTVGIGVPRTR